MLGEIALIGFLPLLLAAPAAPPPSTAEAGTANCSVPVEAPSPEEANQLRAERLLGEFLAPLAERSPDAATASRLHTLITQLGSEEWPVREAASRALVRCGMAAVSALREAARSRDPEVTFRARLALGDIPDDGLARILRGLDVWLGGSAPGRQRRIVSELAGIPDAAQSALVRSQEKERSAEGDCERLAKEANGAEDPVGGELHRLAGRVARSRLCALLALSEHLNREIADLRAAAETAKAEAESKAKAKTEAARSSAVVVVAPAPAPNR
jgi:hypothetical protein